MNRRIIVYGITKERADNKLQEILDNTLYGEIKEVRKGKHEFIVIMKNGDIYTSLTCAENCRGHKWNYAYIDNSISRYLFERVILNGFISSKDIHCVMESDIYHNISFYN